MLYALCFMLYALCFMHYIVLRDSDSTFFASIKQQHAFISFPPASIFILPEPGYKVDPQATSGSTSILPLMLRGQVLMPSRAVNGLPEGH
jgi:hypothetical protein